MRVKEVMSKNPRFIRPDITIREAAQLMRDDDVGCLPVGEDDRLTGMLTDRDIAVRAVAADRDAAITTAGDIMSPGIRYCFENDSLEEAAKHLQEHKIRRLVVLNHQKRLVGILSLSDIATGCDDKHLAGAIEGEVCRKVA